MQGAVTGASSGAQEDAVKAEAKVQDLQGRLKLAEQDKASAEKAQKVSLSTVNSCSLQSGSGKAGWGGVGCCGAGWGAACGNRDTYDSLYTLP